MQKVIIIALLCATAYSLAGTATAPISASVGQIDGYVVTAGVSVQCHRSCKTCTGALASECVTCAVTDAVVTSGTCACASGSMLSSTLATPTAFGAPKCVVATTSRALLECNSGQFGLSAATVKLCVECDVTCQHCLDGTAGKCVTKTAVSTTSSEMPALVGCWGGLTHSSATGGTCGYSVAKSYLNGSAHTFVQSATAGEASALLGYFYVAADFTYTQCKPGCKVCTSATAGCTCATGFMPKATAEDGCECPAAGYFATDATATTLGACTACGTGCTTCSSATVCTVCDSSHSLGATTDSSSTCEAAAVDTSATTTSTDDTTTATTADGESTSATTATSGVLITAASMLLAVILA